MDRLLIEKKHLREYDETYHSHTGMLLFASGVHFSIILIMFGLQSMVAQMVNMQKNYPVHYAVLSGASILLMAIAVILLYVVRSGNAKFMEHHDFIREMYMRMEV